MSEQPQKLYSGYHPYCSMALLNRTMPIKGKHDSEGRKRTKPSNGVFGVDQ